jgi:organic radical activating enzyme
MIESKVWCPIPWSHIAVKSNGSLRICSHSQSGGNKNTLLENDGKILRIDNISEDILNCDTLKEVRKKFINNEWPDQCRRCRLEQESGKRSRNQWETLMYNFSQEDAEKITLDDGTIKEQKILSMDLRLGNKCNLQCVMCYPGESNQWYKIQEQITGSKIFMIDSETYSIDDHKHFAWCDQDEYYELLTNYSHGVEKIKFGGGEPFLVKPHAKFLQNLIDLDLSKNIELEYSINVTILPERFLDLLSKFKKVKLCCSIDGYGEVNDAIRHPSRWDIIEKNLNSLDSLPETFEVFTSTTVSILNIEHFVTWMNWLEGQRFKKINSETYAGVVSHPVMNPKYLNLRLMDDNQNKKMFDHLKTQTTNQKMIKQLDQWEMYSKKLPMTTDEILQGRKDLKNFFKKMTIIQNKDWAKIFPMCYEIIQEWKE